MHLQPSIPIACSRRLRLVRHLAVVSIATVLALQGSAAHVSAERPATGHCSAVSTMLATASAGLLMPSESDFPFTTFTWTDAAKRPLTAARVLRLTGHPADAVVEVVELDTFFRNVAQRQPWHDAQQATDVRKFQRLERVLERHLTGVRVYRIGTIRIDAYIVGRCGRDLAGLSTVVIET